MFAKRGIWLAYLIVFVSSACGLILELVAGRIMAPYIGVSLYTWTSIIGIVLAGMSLGNFVGGWVADRWASRGLLGVIFTAGALASVGVLVMTNVVTSAQLQMSLIPKIVLFTTAIFFLPSVIIGMVSPIVVKLALQSLERTGNTVGSIYAFSTAGSIFGTFVTGFVLISWLGTRTIVWIVALTLLVTGVLVGGFWRPKGRAAALVVTLLACGAVLWSNSGANRWLALAPEDTLLKVTAAVVIAVPLATILRSPALRHNGHVVTILAVLGFSLVYLGWDSGMYRAPCQVESNYFCIRTTDTEVDRHHLRALVLDHLIHSYVALDDPKVLGYGYERVYAEVTQYYAAEHPELDTLFIGGGGYTFPRYVEAVYPHSSADVLEIDPAVTKAAHDFLNMPQDTKIRSFNGDARSHLMEWSDPKKYDIIYGDAFNDLSVPYHLTTVEFDQMLASRLKDDGIYMINVIDKFEGGEFMKAFLNSLRQVFPHVYLLSQGEAWKGKSSNTYILLASKQPFDYAKMQSVVGPDATTKMLPSDELDAYLASGRPIVLTDDYVPVDQLVARLFVERGY